MNDEITSTIICAQVSMDSQLGTGFGEICVAKMSCTQGPRKGDGCVGPYHIYGR